MNDQFKKVLEQCVVVLTAGGEGSRFRSVPGADGIQKAAYKLPNGETMIERTINMYKAIGLTHFAILVYHNADSIEKALGNGEKLGVSVRYSYDPEVPVGRGGAVKNAYKNGTVKHGSYLIVHNPDDQIIDVTVAGVKTTRDQIVIDAIKTHIENEKKGAVATAVMAEGTAYEFTGFKIKEGFVTDVEMYPFIEVPTHVGMTIFSPDAEGYFEELFDLAKKNDFEAVLFPVLKEERKLAAHLIPRGSWISVNDEKGLKKLVKTL